MYCLAQGMNECCLPVYPFFIVSRSIKRNSLNDSISIRRQYFHSTHTSFNGTLSSLKALPPFTANNHSKQLLVAFGLQLPFFPVIQSFDCYHPRSRRDKHPEITTTIKRCDFIDSPFRILLIMYSIALHSSNYPSLYSI